MKNVHTLIINDDFKQPDYPMCLSKADDICCMAKKLKENHFQNVSITNNLEHGYKLACGFKFDVVILEIKTKCDLSKFLSNLASLRYLDKSLFFIYTTESNMMHIQKLTDVNRNIKIFAIDTKQQNSLFDELKQCYGALNAQKRYIS